MSRDYKVSAVHVLRAYIWKLLQDELGWTKDNYADTNGNKYVPIITPQQEKLFNEFTAPYIVYAFARTATGANWAIENEVSAFTVYSPDDDDITEVTNLLQTKLNKHDDSAYDLNEFVSKSAVTPFKTFDFKDIWVSTVQGPQPTTEEGGRRDGLVTINMTYTQEEFDEEANRRIQPRTP